ncbi:hypothetical protein NE479_06010 [Phascolarctobacterium faecium]|uniref:gp53-like domain-containing protein n=1 Tax=Phascolarctobacterium faecium TaxID=33025 RepID=UPI00383EE0D8|nr:hypothetical protein [Phascolarctobacterium faecium]
MVLLSITPLLDGVLRLDIIAPFHTSGPPLLQFHLAIEQWGSSASLSGYVAVCIFPISFTTTDYTAVATGVMSAADATFGKENYVNNILWDFTSESQVAFRLSHLDRPTLRYIAIGF